MATAKKTVPAPALKKTTKAAAPAKAPATKAVSAKAVVAKLPAKPPAKKLPAKKAAATKAVSTKASAKPVATKAAGPLKPIKTVFNKTGLLAHVAQLAAVELKAVKAVLSALEETILASIHKKGLGSFTLPGLLKISAQTVPAKKKRLGKDPFTGVERMFAAKPATTKIKARALKKLKDAAL